MYFFVLLFCAFANIAQPASLPTNFKKCSFKDNNCLKISMEDAIRKMITGVPSLNIPSIDPIKISQLNIPSGKGPVDIDQHYSNVVIYGFTTLNVLNFKLDLEKKTIDFETTAKNITFKADYDMQGRVLLLPVYGNGPTTLLLEELRIPHHIQFEEIERKGKKYLKVVDYKIKLQPKKVTYNFENLFNGDKALGDAINKVLNDNNLVIFEDVQAGYEESFGIIFKDLTNKIFTRVPLNEIFIYDK